MLLHYLKFKIDLFLCFSACVDKRDLCVCAASHSQVNLTPALPHTQTHTRTCVRLDDQLFL